MLRIVGYYALPCFDRLHIERACSIADWRLQTDCALHDSPSTALRSGSRAHDWPSEVETGFALIAARCTAIARYLGAGASPRATRRVAGTPACLHACTTLQGWLATRLHSCALPRQWRRRRRGFLRAHHVSRLSPRPLSSVRRLTNPRTSVACQLGRLSAWPPHSHGARRSPPAGSRRSSRGAASSRVS